MSLKTVSGKTSERESLWKERRAEGESVCEGKRMRRVFDSPVNKERTLLSPPIALP